MPQRFMEVVIIGQFELSVSVTQQHTGSQIIECVVDRGGARLEVSKGLWTYLFFSCEPFEQALLVNLVLSERARGGSSHLALSHRGHCVQWDPRVRPWMLLW